MICVDTSRKSRTWLLDVNATSPRSAASVRLRMPRPMTTTTKRASEPEVPLGEFAGGRASPRRRNAC
eukprot:9794878-Alexandrium_andersonii.AAC.1